MEIKLIDVHRDMEMFEDEVKELLKKGYKPKYESFRISFNDFGGLGHYVILMVKA